MLAEPILAAIVLNTIPEYYPISVTKVSLSKIKTMRVWDLALEKATLIEEEDGSTVVTGQDETVKSSLKKNDVLPTVSEENQGTNQQKQQQRNRTLRWQPSMGDQPPTSPTIVRTASTASSSYHASPSVNASASPFSAWYSLAVTIADQMLCCSYSGNQVGVEQTIDHVVPLRRQDIDRKAKDVEHQHDILRKNQSSPQVLSSVKSNTSSSSIRKSFENVGNAPSPASPLKTFVLVQESKNKGVKQPKQQRQQRSRGSRRRREPPSPEMTTEDDDCSETLSRCDTVTTASISSDSSSARSWNTLPTKVSSCDDDPTEGEDDFYHSFVRQEASNHYCDQPGRFLPASPAWQYLPSSHGDSLQNFSLPLTHSHSSSHSSRSKRTQPWEMSIEFRRTFTDPESAQQVLYSHVQSESLQHAQRHYQHSRQIALYADV